MSLINDALKRANEAQKKRPTSGPLGAPLRPAEAQKSSLLPAMILPVILLALLGGGFWLISAWWKSRAHTTEVVAVNTPSAPAKVTPAMPNPPVPQPVHPAEVKQPTAVASSPNIPPQPIVVAKPPPPTPKVVASAPTPAPTPVVTPPAPKPVPAEVKPKPVDVAVVTPPTPAPTQPEPRVEEKTTVTPAPAPTPVVAATPPPPKPEFPTLKLQGIFYRRTNPSALISGKTVFVGEKVQGAKVIEIDRQSVTLEFQGEKKTYSFE